MDSIKIFTIGFTKKNAETFFTGLKKAGTKRIIDIRLNNVSQLSGFAKKDDLKYFLKELCNCDYIHLPQLAPTKELLDGYKKKKINWMEYEKQFIKILQSREAQSLLSVYDFDNSCLLCSEPTPEKCHRRLVAEFLQKHSNNVEISHL
jgi:uncharacterized protein (DUF488 family)